MIGIDAFDARASVSALLRANRVATPEQPPASTDKSSVTKTVGTDSGPSFRVASAPGSPVFAIDLTAIGTRRDEVSDALSERFKELLEIFHGKGRAADAVETALSSASDLIGSAIEKGDVTGFELRVASIVRSFGGDGEAAFGSVTGFAIEVGLVRGGRVNAEDVQLVGLAGEKLDLSAEQRRTGISDGVFAIRDKAPFEAELNGIRGQNKAQLEALRNALDRLTLVRDALNAYRKGDTRALEQVEKFFRSGTLDAGAVRAIFEVRGSSGQTIVPGSGVFTLS
jgi:hypothetical protein